MPLSVRAQHGGAINIITYCDEYVQLYTHIQRAMSTLRESARNGLRQTFLMWDSHTHNSLTPPPHVSSCQGSQRLSFQGIVMGPKELTGQGVSHICYAECSNQEQAAWTENTMFIFQHTERFINFSSLQSYIVETRNFTAKEERKEGCCKKLVVKTSKIPPKLD